jgi:hypothetical protein
MARAPGTLTYAAVLVTIPVTMLLVLEGATRLFGPDDLFRQTYDPTLLDMRDGAFPYVNRAGYRGLLRSNEVAINSQHLLGPELPADGRPRLLLLGDSVLFAPCIDYDDTPGPVLEGLLDEQFAVLNASSIGYSSEHELAYLREFGPGLEPSMVVLGYCLNDPMSPGAMNLLGVASAKSKKWGGPLLRVNLFLRKHSLFFVWLKGVLEVEKRQNGYAASIEPLFDEASWGRNRQVLRDIHAWCAARDIPFVLAVFPHREQLELGESAMAPQKRLAELAGEFTVIDLTTWLAPEDFLFGDPLHLDRNGIHKSMAVIAGALRDAVASTRP